MMRGIYLLWLGIMSFQRYVRQDLAKEIVVAISSGTVFFLFFYIFSDFLNHEISAISLRMRDSFAQQFSYILLIVSAFLCGRQIFLGIYSPRSLNRFAHGMGETRSLRLFYLSVQIIAFIGLYFCAGFFIAERLFHPQFSKERLSLLTLMMVVCATAAFFLFRINAEIHLKPKAREQKTNPKTLRSPRMALFAFRIRSFFGRNYFARLALGAALALASLALLLDSKLSPVLLYYLVAFVTGIFAASALISQAVHDCTYGQFEKGLGTSHDDYLSSLQFLATLVASLSGFVCLTISATSFILTSEIPPISVFVKIFFMAFIPPWLVPYLAFQIDPRKSLVQMLTLVLVALFVNTAVLASLLGLLLLPLIAYYGLDSQRGRYYRA